MATKGTNCAQVLIVHKFFSDPKTKEFFICSTGWKIFKTCPHNQIKWLRHSKNSFFFDILFDIFLDLQFCLIDVCAMHMSNERLRWHVNARRPKLI